MASSARLVGRIGGLAASLYLQSGKSCEIYTSFGATALIGSYAIDELTLDALNASTINIWAEGGNITSSSGEFLGFAKTSASGSRRVYLCLNRPAGR